jgi:hypothetical protein
MSEVSGQSGKILVLLSTFIHQCSSQYSSQVCCLSSPSSAIYSIYTESGDICIVRSIIAPIALPEFDDIIMISNTEEDSDNPELQTLTNELQAITEKATDWRFETFQIRWGLRDGELPFMLDGPECDAPLSIARELLCLALEIVVQPQPGKCITPERVCVGADRSIQRKKVAIFRIRKFFDKSLPDDQLDEIIARITRKFNDLYPDSTLKNVSCCSHCFALFHNFSKVTRFCTTASTKASASSKCDRTRKGLSNENEEIRGVPENAFRLDNRAGYISEISP